MELRRAVEDGQQVQGLLRGWCLGSKEFRKELLARMSAKAGPGHSREEIRESAEEKAQQLVGQELKKLGWEESELSRRRKGDKRKIKIFDTAIQTVGEGPRKPAIIDFSAPERVHSWIFWFFAVLCSLFCISY